MANKGLKFYANQLQLSLNNVAIFSLSLFEDNANLFVTIPLLKTFGRCQIETSLIFNLLDRDTIPDFFGYGFRSNHYLKTTDMSLDPTPVENADGLVDYYEYDSGSIEQNNIIVSKFKNPETSATLLRCYQTGSLTSLTYQLKDKYGNTIYFSNDSNYPSSIKNKNNESIILDFIAATKTIRNSFGDIISFTKTGDVISRVYYTHGNDELGEVLLSYTNNRITSVVWKQQNTVISQLSIIYDANYIEFIDEIAHKYIKFFITSNKVSSFIQGNDALYTNSHALSISYNDTMTTLEDYEGTKIYHFFDSNGVPLYSMDNHGKVGEIEFDELTKDLISKSNPIKIGNQQESNLFPSSIQNFSVINGSIAPQQISNPIFSNLLNSTNYRITPNDNTLTSLSYSISIDGIATDQITAAIWGLQITPRTDSSYVEVKLKLGNDNTQIDADIFKKQVVDDNFDFMTLGVNAKKTYSSITLEILCYGGAIIDIAGIQVLQKPYGTFLMYDENGNVVGSEANGVSSSSSYDEDNMPTEMIGGNSSMYLTSYNARGNVDKTYSAYGNLVVNEYDTANPDNIISTEIQKRDGKKILTEKVYSSDGRFLLEEKDELDNSTSYSYDNFGRILSITDSLNSVINTEYNNNGTIHELLLSFDNHEIGSQYTYNSQKRISSVTLSNGASYSITYDSRSNIASISLNGVALFLYTYDNDNNLVSMQYGSSGDAYSFLYNSSHQIESIHYGLIPTPANLRYLYTYNSQNLLYEIKDSGNNLIKRFTYDNLGRVIKEENGVVELAKRFNDFGKQSVLSIKHNNKITNVLYDDANRSMGSHPESILYQYKQNNNQYVGIFSINSTLQSKDYDLVTKNHSGSQTYFAPYFEGAIPFIRIKCSNLFGYDLHNMYNGQTGLINGGVQFWFKGHITDSSKVHNLIQWKPKTGNSLINVYVKNNKVYLKVKDSTNHTYNLLTSEDNININSWNFFALSFANDVDITHDTDMSEYLINVNGRAQKYKKTDGHLNVLIGDNQYFDIGHFMTSPTDDPIMFINDYFDITGLYIANKRMLKQNEIYNYFRISKDYITDNQVIEDDINTVDFSETSLLNVSANYQNQFDIFPLHNDVLSLKGTRPVKFSLREASPIDKDSTFNFNKLIKRYCYIADGSELSYNLGSSDEGTIVARIFTDVSRSNQTIFELQDAYLKTIGLYRNNDKQLVINYNGTLYETQLVLSNNTWHVVSFSFKTSTVLSQLVKTFRVTVDNQTFTTNSQIIDLDFDDFIINVGRTYNQHLETISWNLGFDYSYYELYGQIEMLCFSNNYETIATINSLASQLVPDLLIHEFDDIGMNKRIHLLSGDSTILKQTYKYKTRSNSDYISKLVASEKITRTSSNTQITNRQYTYDALGQVTKITDSTFGTHNYQYDYRGYLTEEDNIVIEYDDNGNITKYGNTLYGYDSVIKDRLISVGGNPITYDNNIFNPVSYNGNTYQYEGRRLISFTNSNNQTYQYQYDDQGKRIKKITPNNTYQFFYSDNKLVTQIDNNNTLDFLYDENNELFGFILNGEDKYFYVRDVLRNILGVVNASGTLLVKYNIDAYGNCVSITDTSNIGLGMLNPFRYKGYYYDQESDMYYCLSRYYVPTWRRWLNADNPLYVEFNNQTSVNLFTYCKNNPISNKDEDGHFLGLLIGACITGLIVGAASFAVCAIAGLVTGTFDLRKCLCAAAGGFLGGFVGFFIPGSHAFLQAFVSGFVNSFSSKMLDLSTDGQNHDAFDFLLKPLISGIIGGLTSVVILKIRIFNGDKMVFENYNYLHGKCFDFAFKNGLDFTAVFESIFIEQINDLKKTCFAQLIIDVIYHGIGRFVNNDSSENDVISYLLGWCI